MNILLWLFDNPYKGYGAKNTRQKHRVSISFEWLTYEANLNNLWINYFWFWADLTP